MEKIILDVKSTKQVSKIMQALDGGRAINSNEYDWVMFYVDSKNKNLEISSCSNISSVKTILNIKESNLNTDKTFLVEKKILLAMTNTEADEIDIYIDGQNISVHSNKTKYIFPSSADYSSFIDPKQTGDILEVDAQEFAQCINSVIGTVGTSDSLAGICFTNNVEEETSGTFLIGTDQYKASTSQLGNRLNIKGNKIVSSTHLSKLTNVIKTLNIDKINLSFTDTILEISFSQGNTILNIELFAGSYPNIFSVFKKCAKNPIVVTIPDKKIKNTIRRIADVFGGDYLGNILIIKSTEPEKIIFTMQDSKNKIKTIEEEIEAEYNEDFSIKLSLQNLAKIINSMQGDIKFEFREESPIFISPIVNKNNQYSFVMPVVR